MMMCWGKRFAVFVYVFITPFILFAQQQKWVDSVLATLSTQEKIAQLLMTRTDAHAYAGLVKSGVCGWLCVPHPTNIPKASQPSKVPVFTGVFTEGSFSYMDSTASIPSLALSAVGDSTLLKNYVQHIAQQMKMSGVHWLFQSSLAANKYVKKLKTLGDIPEQVEAKKKFFQQAYTDASIFYSDEVEPKENATIVNISSFGLFITPLSTWKKDENYPVALTTFLNEQLRKKNKFDGLFFADISQWTKKLNQKEHAVLEKIIPAGIQILYTDNPRKTAQTVARLIRKNKSLEQVLNESVKKVLRMKWQKGLWKKSFPDQEKTDFTASSLYHSLIEKSVTLWANETSFPLPVDVLYYHISLGGSGKEFTRTAKFYVPIETFALRQPSDTLQLARLKNFSPKRIIVTLHAGAEAWLPALLPYLQKYFNTPSAVISFYNPDWLRYFSANSSWMATYYSSPLHEQIAAQMLFGARAVSGQRVLSFSTAISRNTFRSPALPMLAFATPESVGMDKNVLEKIKLIAREAVEKTATPGGQVAVARHGKIVFQHAFGWQTYTQEDTVTNETIYDLASLTKTMTTLNSVMTLYDKNQLDLFKKASYYLPELKNTNKETIIIKDLLVHQAGLVPTIFFWQRTVRNGNFSPDYFRFLPDTDFPNAVTSSLYTGKNIQDVLWKWIIDSPLADKPFRAFYEYKYSDNSFYFLQHVVEKMYRESIQNWFYSHVSKPMGMHSLGYNPLERFDEKRIAPTENDLSFRKTLLRGYVHDQGAAMLGGVAGHAGLFGTSADVLKMGQLWLQKGTYGKTTLYAPATVDLFTQKTYSSSRRGLGFDKPTVNQWSSLTALEASPETFGHTGFTGTCVWVDPAYDLVYVFISNRIHPDANNNKLNDLRIRQRIQQVVYQSIFEYEKMHE